MLMGGGKSILMLSSIFIEVEERKRTIDPKEGRIKLLIALLNVKGGGCWWYTLKM